MENCLLERSPFNIHELRVPTTRRVMAIIGDILMFILSGLVGTNQTIDCGSHRVETWYLYENFDRKSDTFPSKNRINQAIF